MNKELCIFIISHGRANEIYTIETLRKAGSKLPFYIVIDDHDKTANEYFEKYGEIVCQFDKTKYAQSVDNYDNLENYRSTTHARNACFDFAEKLGYEYFLVFDDDYTAFKFRIDNTLNHPKSCPNITSNIDLAFLSVLKYYKSINATSICLSQGGDWFGGEAQFNKKPKRKAMNSFFCSTERRFWFESRLNEDVNTYMRLGETNNVFFTIPFIQLDQIPTQKTKGGMSEAYLDGGTYVKSFYTVLCRPDCVKVNQMGRTNKRFHHLTNWKSAVPCIIPESCRKPFM